MVPQQLIDLPRTIRDAAFVLGGSRKDYDELLELCSAARFVCLGEASHGTHEHYRERARITQRLIAEHGFNAVVVEADWPDADRANRWAQGRSDDGSAEEALSGFKRFPSWMWRNRVVIDFIRWLRSHDSVAQRRVMFCGMDLYGLQGSIESILKYLRTVDPEAAERARARYACFEMADGGGEDYGRALRLGMQPSCEAEAVEQLVEMQRRSRATVDPELFSAEQNARLARNAEAYYRAMFGSRVSTWNLRDRHMAETLESIASYLLRRDGYARVAVWAHNSHLGDARFTAMSDEGELNVGQLLRERYGDEAVLVGFTTYGGSVTAATDWGAPPERMRIRPALQGSIEHLLHEVGLPRFVLPLRGAGEALGALREPLLERAIGVVYRPETERASHYFEARVASQFDALVHVDRTRAVEPLELNQLWTSEPPETYPTAI